MSLYLQIALNIPLNQTFTYLNISDKDGNFPVKSKVGCRADIKFGNRHTTGYVVSESDKLPKSCPVTADKIRPIIKFLDEEPLFTPELYDLALFVSKYYLCSEGEALSMMLPGGRRETNASGFSFADEAPDTHPHDLSDEQKKAVDEILSNSKTYLHYLYGPTGSGKTEVFLQAAEKLLKQGKGVIYLVPEIGLTQQVIEAVVSRFGQTAAVLHSGLTPSQRLREWRRILNKEACVVVGARSAVFAPVPDLGMIIIDEEHDGSYKSGSTPRYHARQVAMYRCSKKEIPLVMGSATPSVEAWHLMDEGKIIRHTLTRRLAGGEMPKISCVNLGLEQSNGECLSKELCEEIKKTLSEKKQVILFLNRRGFTHFFRCNTCGYELKCKNCSVPLTYHKNEKRLRCHYCGYSIEPPSQCPKCGSIDVGYSGFGTEYIEAEVEAKFPNAKIVRIDTDSLTHKGELQEKLDAFKKGEYDIMLGTQMVAKGLNFPQLQLVGVVLADTGLHMPDFRAAERTFSLITQVSGRAGRFQPDGKVLIQSYNPSREPIAYAVKGDIDGFYKQEIEARRQLNFPPFSRLIRLVFRAPTRNESMSAASGAAQILSQNLAKIISNKKSIDAEILGPAECPIVQMSMNWRYQLILRGSSINVLQTIASTLLYGYTQPNNVYIECDVDPVNLL